MDTKITVKIINSAGYEGILTSGFMPLLKVFSFSSTSPSLRRFSQFSSTLTKACEAQELGMICKKSEYKSEYPANIGCGSNAVLLSVLHLQCWPNTKPALGNVLFFQG